MFLYYGGDGSQKYFFDDSKKDWGEDNHFRSVFSDSQGIAVLGKEQYRNVLKLSFSNYDDPSAEAEKELLKGAGFWKRIIFHQTLQFLRK